MDEKNDGWGWYGWVFKDTEIARGNKVCGKCGRLIDAGEFQGTSGMVTYHERCIGFIASRYHKVDLKSLNKRQLKWKEYYDQEILNLIADKNKIIYTHVQS